MSENFEFRSFLIVSHLVHLDKKLKSLSYFTPSDLWDLELQNLYCHVARYHEKIETVTIVASASDGRIKNISLSNFSTFFDFTPSKNLCTPHCRASAIKK